MGFISLPIADYVNLKLHRQLSLPYMVQWLTLPETSSKLAPENRWLEYDRFLLGFLFSGANLLVSGRVYKVYKWKCLEIGWSDDSADMMKYPVSVKSFVPPKAITLFVWSILLWAMDAWIYLFTLIHANQLQGGSRRFKIDVVFSSMIFGVHHKNLVTWENQP